MRAISAAVLVALGAVALGQNALATTKPSDGKCECGAYIEAPALCRSLPASRQEPCRKSNAAWFDQCVAWQEQSCTSGVLGAVAKSIKLVAPVPSVVPKYDGTWMGATTCPSLGSWNLMLSVRQQPDGSTVVKAATEGIGEFRKLTLTKDNATLLYSSLFKDTSYVGRLVSPNRIEGTAKIQQDCTWYLTK